MMAKRGLALDMVHFFSYPYTSPEAKDKVLRLAELLTPWCGRLMVHVVPFTAIQEELRRKCPEELFTILMRRFMMRIAQAVAGRVKAGALITGESLGQVASQTMDAMRLTGGVCGLPILRPCVGMDKEEIVTIARKIGTFETSILPYEDCCTVFTPRHPRLHPLPGEIEAAEALLDVEGLVQAAVDGIERIKVGFDPAHQKRKCSHDHTAELIAVGTELLLGNIANTDAQMLSQGLSALGINVYYHTVVGDNPGRLRAAVELAKSRADLIDHGGAGPHLRRPDEKCTGRVLWKKAGP